MKYTPLPKPGSQAAVVDRSLGSGSRPRPQADSTQLVPSIEDSTSQLRRMLDLARDAGANRGLYGTLPLLALPLLYACGGGGSGPVVAPNDNPMAAGDNAIEVDEGAAYVLTVTDLSATDPDSDDGPDELTWRVTTDTANGHVALTSDPGSAVTNFTQSQVAGGEVIYVHDGGETTADSFAVQVEDDGRPALKDDPVTVDVAVSPVNDPAMTSGDLAISVDQGASRTLNTADIAAVDPDDSADNLTWRVTTDAGNGYLALSSAPATAITSFTQAQVAAGDVIYVHDGGQTTADSFTVQVEDDGTPALTAPAVTVAVSVSPTVPDNQSPTAAGDLAIEVDEGASYVLTVADLSATDPDDVAENLTWRVTTDAGNGHLALSAAPATAITSFTQAQVAAGDVIYVHDGGQTTPDSFTVQVEDDGTPALTAPAVTVAVSVSPTVPDNQSPTAAGDLAIEVDEGASYVLTVADLSATDQDDVAENLTWRVTTDAGNGHLALSAAPATAITWFTQAQVAAGDVIYVHDGGQTTADSFTVQVEDDGTPALTAPAVTVAVSVLDEPDQPPGPASLAGPGTVAPDAASGDDIGTLSATDPDPGDGMPSFTIVSVAGEDGSTVITTHPFAVANGVLEIATGATANELAELANNARFTVTVRAADADDASLFTDTDFELFVIAEQIGTDGADTLDGADNQADALRGLARNDILDGMGGPDILDGGRGDDTLTGGAGADVFVYRFDSSGGGLPSVWEVGDLQTPNADGFDQVLDFNTDEGDRLLFIDENTSASRIDSLAEFKAAFDLAANPNLAAPLLDFATGAEFIRIAFGAPDESSGDVSGDHVLELFTAVQIPTDLYDDLTGQFNDVDAFIAALGGDDALQFG